MPKKRIPDRWEAYTAIGKVIARTNFIAFKVPLKEELCGNIASSERFTTSDLVQRIPELGLVIDLTNTTRYYNPEDLKQRNIMYEKIFCEGHRVPSQEVTQKFFQAVHNFCQSRCKQGSLVGVHCTHGLNRTGYLICRYMIDSLGFTSEEAIKEFEKARGHKMERSEYIEALFERNESYQGHGGEVRLPSSRFLPPKGPLGIGERDSSILPHRWRESGNQFEELQRGNKWNNGPHGANKWNVQNRHFSTLTITDKDSGGYGSIPKELKKWNVGPASSYSWINEPCQPTKYSNERMANEQWVCSSGVPNRWYSTSSEFNKRTDEPRHSRSWSREFKDPNELSIEKPRGWTNEPRKSNRSDCHSREYKGWNSGPKSSRWLGESRQSCSRDDSPSNYIASCDSNKWSGKSWPSKRWNSEPSHSDVWDRESRGYSKWKSESYICGTVRRQRPQTQYHY